MHQAHAPPQAERTFDLHRGAQLAPLALLGKHVAQGGVGGRGAGHARDLRGESSGRRPPVRGRGRGAAAGYR